MTDQMWNKVHVRRLARDVANKLGSHVIDDSFDYKGHHIDFIHEVTDLNNGIAYLRIDGDSSIPIPSNDVEETIEVIERNIMKGRSKMSFNDMLKKQKDRNSGLTKTPIMMSMLMDSPEDVDRLNENLATVDPEMSIQEIDALAPNASVTSDGFAIDVIWFLPSKNHPGLWIVPEREDWGITGKFKCHVTAKYFDYPDEEGISGFIEELDGRIRHQSMSADEVKSVVREMQDRLGPIASKPYGIPVYKGMKKYDTSKEHMDYETWDNSGYMAMECAEELRTLAEAFENPPSMLDFNVSGQEYYNKLLECKKMADWLVDNIRVWMN